MQKLSGKFPLNGIRVVILDLDGTMIDSVPDLDVALNGMLEELTLPPVDVSSIRMFVGRGTQNLVRSTLSVHLESDETEKTMDIAMTLFYKHYRIVNGEHSAVFPGVREGLEQMKKKKLHIACVTNKPSIFTEPLLAKNGLYPYFSLIYCSDTFLVKKPDPFPMQMACRKFGCRPDQAVAIGDSINDAQAAKAAGCSLFMVPYGYNYGKPVEEMNPDAVVFSLHEASGLVA